MDQKRIEDNKPKLSPSRAGCRERKLVRVPGWMLDMVCSYICLCLCRGRTGIGRRREWDGYGYGNGAIDKTYPPPELVLVLVLALALVLAPVFRNRKVKCPIPRPPLVIITQYRSPKCQKGSRMFPHSFLRPP